MGGLPQTPPQSSQGAKDQAVRLDSWKEIAAYLSRDIRTVQRWEKTANLPVRRLQKPGLRAVYAYATDLDEWLRLQGSPQEEEAAKDPRASRPRRWLPFAGLAFLIVAGGATLTWLRTPKPFESLAARPITSDPGSERDPDISPDGKYIAYVAVSPDLRARLQVRLIEGGEPRAITSAPEEEWSPAWSPDGSHIAFLRGDPGGQATLLLITALGSEERRLADVRPYARRRTLLIGHLLAWTPNGRHLVVTDHSTGNRSSLFLINVESGERTQLTWPNDAEFDVEPSLSSDGRRLLFNRVRGEFLSDAFIQELNLTGRPIGPPRKLSPAGDWNGTPRLLEDRDEVLTCSGSLPRLSLWRQPAGGSGKPVSLGIMGDYAVQSAVHQPTQRIVSRTYRAQSDILRYSLPSVPSSSPQPPPVQGFLESTFVDRSPAYSPDGKHIAFVSDRTGRRQLWVSDASGAHPTEWTQKFEVDGPVPVWSVDGSRIVFLGGGPSGQSQVYVADRTTRSAVRLTDDTLDYSHAVWSHDGKHLFVSAANKSVYGIYRLPAAGGAAEIVVPDYRYVAGVEPTGKGLYLTRTVRRNQRELDYFRLPAGPPVHLATVNFPEDAWVTQEGVYYLLRREDRPIAPVTLYFRTHAGGVRLLQEYSSPPGRGLSVSPDGRLALTTRVVPPISDLILLERAR